MIDILPELLSQIARGGGGGSSGGGGGGGGEFIALIGYLPSYYAGKLIKKWLPRKQEIVVSLISAAIVSAVLILVANHLHSGTGWLITFFVVLGVWAGWAAAFFGAWDKIKDKAKKTSKKVETAAQLDSAWAPDELHQIAKSTFLKYQADWSSFDVGSIQTYTTERYARHVQLLLRALQEMHRVNDMSNIMIEGTAITEVADDTDNQKDTFTIAINASANDTLRNTQPDKSLFSDNSSFIEYWSFVRQNNTWLLDGIQQETADLSSQNKELKHFAETNNMYYSLDMGWLLLPNSGVLFGGGAFGKSDINNHVIGLYGQNIVQLYSYIDDKKDGTETIVAQINLPRSYGGISIRRKHSFWSLAPPQAPKPPKDYKHYSFEWPDFNKRYIVSATNQDRLATFELLNPGFMAYLYDKDPGVSIEVADNVVYLYTLTGSTNQETYQIMLEILAKAHKELRL